MWTLGFSYQKLPAVCPVETWGKMFQNEKRKFQVKTYTICSDKMSFFEFQLFHNMVEFLKQHRNAQQHRGRNWVFPRLPSCKPVCERQDCLFQPWFPGKSNRRIALMRFSPKPCLSQNGWRSNEEAFLPGFHMMLSLVNLLFTKYLSVAKCVTG